MKTPTKFLLGKVGTKIAKKTGLKAFGAIPVLGDIVDIGVAIYRFSQGDIAGGFLSLGSAIPFVGWGFAALDIAREFNAPFLKDSILEKKRFDNQKNDGNKKKRATAAGSFSKGETVIFNEDTPLPIEFTALTGGKVMTADQMNRISGLKADNGALNMTFLPEIVTDLRSNKGPIPQPKPGDSTLSEETELRSTHGINHFIPEFNIITDLGEKV